MYPRNPYYNKLITVCFFSIVFQILNAELVIWWVIKLKLSLTDIWTIEDVSIETKKGPTIDCQHIRKIVESVPFTSKQYFKTIVENIEKYVQRIGRGIKFRKHNQS